MSDLDDKILELLESMGESYYPQHEYPPSYEPENVETRAEYMQKIKQAFADAGYITPEEVVKWQRTVNVLAESFTQAMRLPTKQYVALNKSQQTMQELMTGQEWYERFAKSFEAAIRDGDPEDASYTLQDVTYLDDFSATAILALAKKAAGIEP